MDASRNHVEIKSRIRDMEVTHVALDADFSCSGVGGGYIWLRGDRRGFRRNRQTFVLYLFDPLCGLASERTNPKGMKQRGPD
jgi:hypothetical protein